jgi:hypothetical protein
VPKVTKVPRVPKVTDIKYDLDLILGTPDFSSLQTILFIFAG